MNTLRSIIRMARANRRWALVALSIDISVGAIAATVVYLLLNVTDFQAYASSFFVLVFGGILSIIGIIAVGYSLLVARFAMDTDTIDLDEELG